MTNVLIAIIDNAEEYSKSIRAIADEKNLSICVGVVSGLEGKLNLPKSVKLEVFKSGSKKEEILNALQSNISQGKLIIIRRPFTKDEFERINQSKAQITYFEKPEKRLIKSVKKAISSAVKFLFGVNFFDGDISLIAFDSDLCEVLQKVNNLSYATRIDRWRGVEQAKVESQLPPVQLERERLADIRLLIFAAISLLLPVLITLLVCLFAKVTVVIGLILFCVCVLGLAGAIMLLCMFYLNLMVGNKSVGKAEKE